MANAASVVRELKQNSEDFEWYPTTDEIIRSVCDDILDNTGRYEKLTSVMDIGAGDGRVLTEIHDKLKLHDYDVSCYAIEKAITHLNNMPKNIIVVGTEFREQTLADKPVTIVFCNPPYSDYEEWMLRIVTEASARAVYLVVPQRWKDSRQIAHVLQSRSAKVHTLGSFDFENADRQARAKVDVLSIEFGYEQRDAFDSVVASMLPELDVFDVELPADDSPLDLISVSDSFLENIVASYNADMKRLIECYRAALRLDRGVLHELNIDRDGVLSGLRLKITGLKKRYWTRLFDEMSDVTKRLATRQRSAFLNSLNAQVSVDFTENNIYAVLISVSKWANNYFDEQLIDLFRTLSNDSAVRYKSNQRVWTKGDWRYHSKDDENRPSHYRLEYRIVLTHGGICTSDYSYRRTQFNGLEQRSFEMLSDIVTVANNLGFTSDDHPRNYTWESNKQHVLKLANGKPLVAVRAFKNGNMHLHFDPKFMLAVNIEAGRLLGWIRNPQEAVQEMDIPAADVATVDKLFGCSFHIAPSTCLPRLTQAPPEPEPESLSMTVEDVLALLG